MNCDYCETSLNEKYLSLIFNQDDFIFILNYCGMPCQLDDWDLGLLKEDPKRSNKTDC